MENQIIYAYVAGLIDGEGTITLTKINSNKKFRYPVLSLTSTTYSFLEYLKSNFGGTICPNKVYKDNHRPSWHWKLIGNKTIDLLIHILPYMLEPDKKYRGNLIVNEYLNLTPRNGKYTADMEKLKYDFEYRFFHPSDTLD